MTSTIERLVVEYLTPDGSAPMWVPCAWLAAEGTVAGTV